MANVRRWRRTLERCEPRLLLAAQELALWQAEQLVELVEDGQSPTTWVDAVAGIEARAVGRPALERGAVGGRAAVAFDPSDGIDLFQITSSNSPLAAAEDFALAVVFQTDSSSLIGQEGDWFENSAIVDASSLGLANDWGLSINQQGRVAFGLGAGFGKAPLTTYSLSAGLNDGNYHLAVVSRQGAELKLRIDDGPTVVAAVHDRPLAPLAMTMGAQKLESQPYDGLLAEVRVFNGSLDDNQWDALWAAAQSFYSNKRPIANEDQYVLAEDTLLFSVSTADGVLANDTDPDGDSLSARLVEDVEHGTLILEADGSFFYDPDPDFFGVDSFRYQAVDFAPSATVTVTLTVEPRYDPPVLRPDSYRGLPTQPLEIPDELGVLGNDANADQVALQVRLDRDVDHGRLVLRADGGFRYDPQGFAGTDQFSYRVDDGTRLSDSVEVQLIVNTAPQANSDRYQATEDRLLSVGVAGGVLANDVDADGDSLTVELVTSVQHGTLQLQPDGSFQYEPAADYFGEDRFSYRVTDAYDGTLPTLVDIKVASVNDPPVGEPDAYFALPATPLIIGVEDGLLANDWDVDSTDLRVELVNPPNVGSLELEATGGFRYTPVADFLGTTTFSYRVGDGFLWSPPTVVELSVTATPVVVSEFMAANVRSLETRTRDSVDESFQLDPYSPDWIELHNLLGQPVDISGMSLTDDLSRPRQWIIPPGTTIPADGFLIIFASGEDVVDPALDETGRLHTNFSLDNGGESLGLYAADGSPLSEFANFPRQWPDISYGVYRGETQFFEPPTPGVVNRSGVERAVEQPTMSVERGFFQEAFPLQIAGVTVGSTLVYTLDGTKPTRTHGTIVPAAAADQPPLVTLPIEGTTIVRAAAFQDGLLPSDVTTETYLFLGDVIETTRFSSAVRDNEVWASQLEASLLALPTISLSVGGRISLSERETSVEMIFPDGTEGFQIDAGVEHYGGHSLNSPKKNMRLSFKTRYGDGPLRYDVFDDGGVSQFRQLLLRTGSHDTFFWTHPSGGRGNYVRNRWAFDRQLEMGQLAPRGRWVHVYIDGKYWGMHHLMERPNADFMASYLGGTSRDYDALNAGTPVDGDSTAWRTLQRREVIGDYDQLGQYLDLENYADYMLLQFFGGNDWDWNKTQNWMAARRREPGAGFQFFAWDSDVILRSTANANVINRGGPGNLWNIRGGVKQHEEFRMLMADRARQYFLDGGLLTSERLRADVLALAEKIRLPIIAETGRWGGRLYTPATWQSAIDWMLDRYAPNNGGGRAETVISQMRRANVYPSIDAPGYFVGGQPQYGGEVAAGQSIRVTAPAGQVYYTLDGTDPRLPGGAVHPNARLLIDPTLLLTQTTRLMARALSDGEWSALSDAVFRVGLQTPGPQSLRITEVNYHPYDPTAEEIAAGFGDADDFEFLEVTNVSDQPVDLTNVQLVKVERNGSVAGIAFAFADSQIHELAPGGRLVVVEDVDAFRFRYGPQATVAGRWDGGLSNASELLTLAVGPLVIEQFTYADHWYPATDGRGPTLQARDEAVADVAAFQRPEAWRASSRLGGSPGEPDLGVLGDANGDGRFDSQDLLQVFQAGEYEDGVPGNSTWEEGDWTGDGEFDSADLLAAFRAGGYTSAAVSLRQDRIDRLFARLG